MNLKHNKFVASTALSIACLIWARGMATFGLLTNSRTTTKKCTDMFTKVSQLFYDSLKNFKFI
jgi:hypothetical protein